MGISKTEINLRRLLASAPHQHNQSKLVYYVSTLRQQLEDLAEEKTPQGLPRVSKALVNDYLEKIEAIASILAVHMTTMQESQNPLAATSVEANTSETRGETLVLTSSKLRRRFLPQSNIEDRLHNFAETDYSAPVKFDAAAQAHIDKHRNLQEDLTDEMVGLAQQLKESSLVMSQSIKNNKKILDSTEKAVEHGLASTGRANTHGVEIYSKSFKTTCFTWLMTFVMTCIFIMVVLLIRVT